MVAAVGAGVGLSGGAQQAHAQLVPERAVAVLGLRQQRDAEAVLGEVGPAMAAGLELREIAGARAMRRALGDAERGLERRPRRPPREREADLQQPMVLVPLRARVDLQAPRAGVQADRLARPRGPPDG